MNDENEVKIDEKEIKRKRKKDNKKREIYPIVCISIIAIVVALLIAFNNVGLLNFDGLTTPSKEKAKLKYTQTDKLQSKGVYITDVSEVVEEVMSSIVSITSKTLVSSGQYGPSFFGYGDRYAEGAGSGIIISQTDTEILILTNNHVIEGAKELSIQFVNEKSVDATIKGTSSRRDVAVVAVKLNALDKETKEAIKIATIGDSSKLKVGNGIIAIGNALGYGQSVTTGVVSAINREVTIDDMTTRMIQIDAAINGGNSGGALLNSVGEVVGINSAKYSSSGSSAEASVEGMGFAIPISDVQDLIEKLMNGKEDDGGATIGIEGNMVSNSQYNMPTGFYITKIIEGSGADTAGLEIGNIITKIEGKDVKSISVIQGILSSKNKGDKVKLTIAYIDKRAYSEKEVEVTLS